MLLTLPHWATALSLILVVTMLLAVGCTTEVAPIATSPPPTPIPASLAASIHSAPIPPTATPAPMPSDYTSEELQRLLDLKGLCGSGEGEYEAWDLATIWLKDREKFNYKIDSGLYGKHWDRTEQYAVDERNLILDLRHAIAEMERVCLSIEPASVSTSTSMPGPDPTKQMEQTAAAALYIVDNDWMVPFPDARIYCAGADLMNRSYALRSEIDALEDKIATTDYSYTPGWHQDIQHLAKELGKLIAELQEKC